MLTPDQVDRCPNCLKFKCLNGKGQEYGTMHKISGSRVKMTRKAECMHCETMITEIWVCTSRYFKTPNSEDDWNENKDISREDMKG